MCDGFTPRFRSCWQKCKRQFEEPAETLSETSSGETCFGDVQFVTDCDFALFSSAKLDAYDVTLFPFENKKKHLPIWKQGDFVAWWRGFYVSVNFRQFALDFVSHQEARFSFALERPEPADFTPLFYSQPLYRKFFDFPETYDAEESHYLFSGERFVRKCWITNDQLYLVSHYCGLTSMIHRTVCHILDLRSHLFPLTLEKKQASKRLTIPPCKTYIFNSPYRKLFQGTFRSQFLLCSCFPEVGVGLIDLEDDGKVHPLANRDIQCLATNGSSIFGVDTKHIYVWDSHSSTNENKGNFRKSFWRGSM